MMSGTTKPEVFIIESLDFKDEKEELFEGRIISQILALSGKRCEYFYIRTKAELKKIARMFSSSRYRYLHLSCHGDADGTAMHTTLDRIPFSELSPILKPHLHGRRLFVSACSMTNTALARQLMPESGCYSILGPKEAIRFNDAAIFWASLYHVLFTADALAMKHAMIRVKASELATTFRVPLNYVRRDNAAAKGYALTTITPAVERPPRQPSSKA
jgi:hypothetical protein